MKLYVKYVLGKIIGPMLLISFSLTCIVWLTQSLRFIDLIINRGLNVSMFLYLSALMLPSLLSIVLPISLLISIAYVYNKLTIDSEMVVLKNAGLSKLSIIKPALAVALVVTMFGYLISLYLMPASYREFKDLQSFIRDNYVSVLLQEGVFNTPIKGLTVYIREINENGMLKGILVNDRRNIAKPTTMMAEEGKIVKTSAGPRFILVNGNRQEVNVDSGQLSLLYFERYALDLSSFTETETERWREPKERYLNELFHPESTTSPHLVKKLHAEGHHRITWPLYNILLVLIVLTAFITGQFNRRGQARRIIITSSIALFMVGNAITLNNIVAKNPSLTLLMYLIVIGGIIICSYILLRNPKRIRSARPVERGI